MTKSHTTTKAKAKAKAGPKLLLPPGIYRQDSQTARIHGYIVRLEWAAGRPRIKRYFGDYSHGGWRGALRAAVAFRRERVGK